MTPKKSKTFELNQISLSKKNFQILDSVSFSVLDGDIFGLLGRNGSGKSSLLHIMSRLYCDYKGTVCFEGSDLKSLDRRLMRKISVVFQENSLDKKLTVKENLELSCKLYNLDSKECKQQISWSLELSGLKSKEHSLIKNLSGGMRRRLDIMRALIHKPSVLILDEPTSGLDEVAYLETWSLLEELRQERHLTIVLATHRADEAERCHTLAVIDKGVLIALKSPSELKKMFSKDVICLESDNVQELKKKIDKELNLSTIVHDKCVYIECESGHELIPRLASLGHLVMSISLKKAGISEAFMKLTGYSLNQKNTVLG